MSPEKQRIAIAEVCGWVQLETPEVHEWKNSGIQCRRTCTWRGPDGKLSVERDIPDYLNDLNAMREAILTLGVLQIREYGKQIQEVTGWHCVGVVPDYHRDLTHLGRLMKATPCEHAEAFLKTLSLWTED